MWELLKTMWEAVSSGGSAVIGILILGYIPVLYFSYRTRMQNEVIMSKASEALEQLSNYKESVLNRQEKILDRYHTDRELLNQAFGDMKTTLAIILTKLSG